jgi:hypothetical protein
MSQVKTRTILIGAMMALFLQAGEALATGGTYRVASCDAASDRSTAGWTPANSEGMDADRICPRGLDFQKGLLTRNRTQDGRVSQGASASLAFQAPPGTELVRMTYAIDGYRKTDAWTVGLSADGHWLAGCRAGDGGGECSFGNNAQTVREVSVDNRQRIKLEATCADRDGCATHHTGDSAHAGMRAYAGLGSSVIEIRDGRDPGVSDFGGELLGTGWLRGAAQARFTSNDNTGISANRMLIDGVKHGEAIKACTYTRPIPCVTEPQAETYTVDTRNLTDGQHQLELQAVDAAGNVGHVTRTFRVDNNGPTAAFEARSSSTSDRVTVSATDTASGVLGGEVMMREVGTSPWRSLPTSLEPGRLVGRLPLDEMNEGAYEFRAIVRDHAANHSVVERLENGSGAVFLIPGATQMTVGMSGRNGKVASSKRLPYGRPARAVGRLTTRSGSPLAGAAVRVLSRPAVPGGDWSELASIGTEADGRFSYRLPVGSSRELRFEYGGSEKHLPSNAETAVNVESKTTLRSSRHSVKGGGAVAFRGRVRGGPMPRAGKLIDLQAYYRGRWRTFALPRTDQRGRWKRRYKFGATSGLVRYRFRARVPAEEGYAYLPGRSRTVGVRVDGRE